MNIEQIIGMCMLIGVFAGIFGTLVSIAGVKEAIAITVSSFLLTSIIMLAIKLIVSN